MTPAKVKAIVKRFAKLPVLDWLEMYHLAACEDVTPLAPAELRVAQDVLRKLKPRRWFHGGLAGREVGDLLLPPISTGRRDFDAERAPDRVFARVFVTDSEVLARRFADVKARQTGEPVCVYVVEPQGEIEPDHECLRRSILHLADARLRRERPDLRPSLFRSFMCPITKVVEVLELGHGSHSLRSENRLLPKA